MKSFVGLKFDSEYYDQKLVTFGKKTQFFYIYDAT